MLGHIVVERAEQVSLYGTSRLLTYQYSIHALVV